MAKFTKKITNLINQQVPEFVLSDHPKFLEFLTAQHRTGKDSTPVQHNTTLFKNQGL